MTKNIVSLPKRPFRVLCIHSGKREESGACEIYRVTTPLYYLNKQPGWLADWVSFLQLYEVYELNPTEQYFNDLIDSYDLFIWARTYIRDSEDAFESAAYVVNKMRKHGKKIVYEVDDDLTNVYRYTTAGDMKHFASWMDAITVTTPYLANTMQQISKRPVFVLPNMLDPAIWKHESAVKLDREYIRIALTGSKTHVHDWKVLSGVLQNIAKDYPNVRIMLGAYHPEYLRDIPNVELVPPLPYQYYVDLIKNSDIVLAPIDPTDKFNLGKSPIKAIEGMGAARMIEEGRLGGAAVIATNNEVYRLAITHEENGLLVDQTAESWDKAIRRLLNDAVLRKKLQINGFNFVWQKYNLASGWHMWAKTYRKIFELPSNKTIIDHAKSYSSYRKSLSSPISA